MNGTSRACIVTATLLMATPYAAQSMWSGMAISIALGVLWIAGQAAGWHWIADLALGSFVVLAGIGVMLDLLPVVMLLGTTVALVAWDLHRFAERLARAGQVRHKPALVRRHLRRLALVAGLGVLLGSLGLTLRLSLNFGWALVLSFTTLVILSWLLRPAR